MQMWSIVFVIVNFIHGLNHLQNFTAEVCQFVFSLWNSLKCSTLCELCELTKFRES